MAGTLILVRHGQTAGNAEDRFTGWLDPSLTDEGRSEAARTGNWLLQQGLVPDRCFVSALRRSQQTVDVILDTMAKQATAVSSTPALNERDYGQLTGMYREDARVRWGAEQVERWRRGYEDIPPSGESLKGTAARVVPYYDAEIVPCLAQGRTVLVVAHGNSLRVLVMAIEGLTPSQSGSRDLKTGEPIVYRNLNAQGRLH